MRHYSLEGLSLLHSLRLEKVETGCHESLGCSRSIRGNQIQPFRIFPDLNLANQTPSTIVPDGKHLLCSMEVFQLLTARMSMWFSLASAASLSLRAVGGSALSQSHLGSAAGSHRSLCPCPRRDQADRAAVATALCRHNGRSKHLRSYSASKTVWRHDS